MNPTLEVIQNLEADIAEMHRLHQRTRGALIAAGGTVGLDEHLFEARVKNSRRLLNGLRGIIRQEGHK